MLGGGICSLVERSKNMLSWAWLSHDQSFFFLNITCLAIGALLLLMKRKAKPRLPPGPRGWPVVGNLLQLGQLPHQTLVAMAEEYGALMLIRMGCVPTVVVSSPEFAKEILAHQDQNFAQRPSSISGAILSYNYQDVVWSKLDEGHRRLRKVSTQELFSNKRLMEHQDVRREAMRHQIGELITAGSGGRQVAVWQSLVDVNHNYICHIVFGKCYYGEKSIDGEEAQKFKHIIEKLISGSFLTIGDYIPFLKWMDIGGVEKEIRTLMVEFDKFLNGVISEHRSKDLTSTDHDRDRRDFVDVLLAEHKEGLSIDRVKGYLMDLLLAGIDTTANQTYWTLIELMRHPKVLGRIQEEIDSVVGKDRMVQESDLVHFKYLQAVIKESLRLHPVVPLSVPHAAINDTQVGGYDIPAETNVLVNMYAISRSEKVWKDALVFNPDRFLNSSVDVRGQNFEILPFTSGRRVCNGMNLALLMLEFTVASYVHGLDFRLPEGMKPSDVDLEEIFGMTTVKKTPLEVLVSPRLPAHVYSQGAKSAQGI